MIRGRARRATGLVILATTVFSGCYRYVPPSTADLVIGDSYRGHLTAQGSQQVARLMGENVSRFDGRIVTVSDSGYVVVMNATLKRNEERSTVWIGEQLVVPRDAVSSFELRQLDRRRTMRAALLYTLGIRAVGTLVFSINGVTSGNPSGPPGPPPP